MEVSFVHITTSTNTDFLFFSLGKNCCAIDYILSTVDSATGVVVQKEMSMQGMTELYEIKPDLLEHLIKSTIEPLRLRSLFTPRYTLDDYLSGFLQDRDRSQLCYCDPILQHVSICRHILSLLDGTNALGLES